MANPRSQASWHEASVAQTSATTVFRNAPDSSQGHGYYIWGPWTPTTRSSARQTFAGLSGPTLAMPIRRQLHLTLGTLTVAGSFVFPTGNSGIAPNEGVVPNEVRQL